jgi:glycolate oxidase
LSKPKFNRITQKVVDALAEIVGDDHILLEEFDLEPYSHDETEDLRFYPEAAVRPASAAEISEIMKICHENNIPVTTRGGGTGLSGGALPVFGGVVLSVERMNRIVEIDRENMVAVVEPGAITSHIQDAARAEGLMYPPDPSSLDSCSIGGNVAANAGGPSTVKYGTTKDYVLGLEFVLPDGSVITTGGRIVKNATGYNIPGILIGLFPRPWNSWSRTPSTWPHSS